MKRNVNENAKSKWDTVIHHENDYDTGKTDHYIGKAVRDANGKINHDYSGGAYSEGPFPSDKVARRYAKKHKVKLTEGVLRKIVRSVLKEMADAMPNDKFEQAFNSRTQKNGVTFIQYGNITIAIWRNNAEHKWDFECGDEYNRVIPPYVFEPEEPCPTLRDFAKALTDFIDSGEDNSYGFDEEKNDYL